MKNSVLKTILIVFTLFTALQSCKKEDTKLSNNSLDEKQESTQFEIPIAGLRADSLNLDKFEKIWYVSSIGDDQLGDGSKSKPFKTIEKAVVQSTSTINKKEAVLVGSGDYMEGEINLKNGLALFGGFDSNWSRNIEKFKSNIQPREKNQRIIIAADSTKVDGFTISNAQFRGKGAGLYCNGVSITVTNNIFLHNRTLKPTNWKPNYWHETANDGAAIYGENKATLIVKNNIFIGNQTENGRGAALAVDNRCNVIIKDNVIANNTTGLDDGMRSSDEGAVSIFKWCNGQISDNIFLSNKALASNDAGALFIALWSSAEVKNNIFIDNYADDDAGALFVGGQEHRYDGPLDPIPPSDQFFVDITDNTFMGNRNSSMNSGAMRFTMESRGKFEKNITVFNNGIYFQRSEVAVKDNIIMDNFLFIETKEGLLPGEIKNNLIWADFHLDVNPSMSENKIKGQLNDNGKPFKYPKFKADGNQLIPISLNYNNKMFQSTILSNKTLDQNTINRIIRSDNKWGVVSNQSENEITVWGDFSGADSFEVLPTYQVIE